MPRKTSNKAGRTSPRLAREPILSESDGGHYGKLARQELAEDDTFFYKPRTVTILTALVCGLIYVAFYGIPFGIEQHRFAIGVAVFVFLLWCMLNLRNGPFLRPHPAFWRVVQGFSVLYICGLIYLLCLSTVHDARAFLKLVHPDLNQEPAERDYAADCRLYTPEHPESMFYNIKATLMDEFVIAHTFGWFGKMVLLRDYRLCWFMSILFEWLEYSFEFMLPNFAECWWDHFILDILVCNWAGMWLGYQFNKYFSIKQYQWVKINRITSMTGKLQRSLLQFTPHDWTVFEWNMFSSFKRFCYTAFLVFAFETNELLAFFLKNILWVPPRNPLNTIRLVIWWLSGICGIREYYQFITDPHCKKLGAQAWLCGLTICVELLVCIKYGRGLFPNPPSSGIVAAWSIFAFVFVLFCVYFFYFRNVLGWTKKKPTTPNTPATPKVE